MNIKTKSFHRIGVMGTGHMASVMIETIAKMRNATCIAVSSRRKERADKIAKQYGIAKAYGSYEEMAADDEIDMVYVATQNQLHKENAMLCLLHHKPVLVEKPICLNQNEADEIFSFARKEQVFISEAMPIRYDALSRMMLDAINHDKIGEVKHVEIYIGMNQPKIEQLLRPELGGGALYDLGVYGVHLLDMVFQKSAVTIEPWQEIGNTGVDEQSQAIFNFGDGKTGYLFCSINLTTENKAVIYGTRGRIVIDSSYAIKSLEIYSSNRRKVKKTLFPTIMYMRFSLVLGQSITEDFGVMK